MSVLAQRVYRALLRVLPRDFRRAHGSELEALFAERLAEARMRGGRAATVAALVHAAFDVLTEAPGAHRRRHSDIGPREHRLRSFLADLRYAARTFVRQPGSTMLVLVTLTLAVAANTAVFSLVDGLFFRPFPFPESTRLVYVNERAPRWSLSATGIDYADFSTWRDGTSAFAAMSIFGTASFNLADGSASQRINGGVMSYDLPRTLGIQPLVGRTFSKDEDRPHGPDVVLLGEELWRTQFAGSPSIVGKTIRLDSRPHTVVGVLPAAAEFPGGVKLWVPVDEDPHANGNNYQYDGVARLEPGVTVEQAQHDIERAHLPVWAARDTAHLVSPWVAPLRDSFASSFRVVGRALGIGALLVLLIACANVAGTMVARSMFRARELAIRLALGATGSRIVRQLLTESLALAAIAGAAGTLLGVWALRLLVASNPALVPGWVSLAVGPRTVVFSVAIAGVTALLFGLIPALQARGEGTSAHLVAAGGRSTSSTAERRVINLMVAAEVALAAVLLISAGLLVRTYANLRAANPGFRADGAATFRLALPSVRYRGALAQQAFYATLIDHVRALPGVDHAGAVTCLPLKGCHWGRFYKAEGAPPLGRNEPDPVTLTRYASPDYFAAMGITLVHGRVYAEHEGRPRSGYRPVVINEELAHRLWPTVDDPTGKRLESRGDTSANWSTVVGVVRDVKHYGLDRDMIPGLYFPFTRIDSTDDFPSLAIVVHSAHAAVSLVPDIRNVVRSLDPELPVFQASTMQEVLDRSLAQRRTTALAFLAFAAIAVVLAVGGIYATLSYVIGRRRKELSIRIALGAQRSQVLGLVVRQGLALIVVGLAVGLPAALLASRALSALLVGVTPHDATTYIGVAILLVATGIAAAVAPARRAANAEPRAALNEGA